MDDNSILLVEDSEDFRHFLATQLKARHVQVVELGDGLVARRLLEGRSFDTIVLDMNLPGAGGIDLLKWLRQCGSESTVIMISASGEEIDRVLCLELGADDFLVKPFSARELQARIAAVARRRRPRSDDQDIEPPKRAGGQDAGSTIDPLPSFAPTVAPRWPSGQSWPIVAEAAPGAVKAGDGSKAALLSAGQIRLDPEGQRCEVGGSKVILTGLEFRLLHWFMQHPHRVFSRVQLLNAVWGRDYPGYEKAVNNHILRLRRKIGDDPEKPRHIQTVHGSGYRFEP